jgi:beta-glucosidase-like glycosyl hydrolase
MNSHHYTNTTEDTCAAALQGGCDLDCGGLLAQCTDAIQKKTRGLGTADVEQALVRIFSQRIETGEFDEDVSYRTIGLEHFNTSAAQQLALEMARESMVMDFRIYVCQIKPCTD